MHSPLNRLFSVHPGEWPLTLTTLFLSFVLVGIPRVFSLSAASSLFLEHFDASNLPFVYIAGGALTIAVGVLQQYLLHRFDFHRVQIGLVLLLCGITLGFASFLSVLPENRWGALVLFIWFNVEWALTNVIFWSPVNRLFSVRQGKRLFNLIGTGEILAFILGGILAPILIEQLAIHHLLWISAFGQGLGALILVQLIISYPEKLRHEEAQSTVSAGTDKSAAHSLLRNRYILSVLAFFTFAGYFIYYFVDSIFLTEVQRNFGDPSETAAFVANFIYLYGVISLLFRLLLASHWIKLAGMGGAMLTGPLTLLSISALMIIIPVLAPAGGLILWLAVILKLGERITTTAFVIPAYLTLCRPLSPVLRSRVQAAADTLVGPVFTLFAAILLALLTKVFQAPTTIIAAVLFSICILWLLDTLFSIREYPRILASSLKRRLFDETDLALDERLREEVRERMLSSRRSEEVRYCLQILESADRAEFTDTLLELPLDIAPFTNSELRRHIYQAMERIASPRCSALLEQRLTAETVPACLGALLRALAACEEDDAYERLLFFLQHGDHTLSSAAMIAMLRYGGLQGAVAAGGWLMKELASPTADSRRYAAEVLGEVGEANFYRGLIPLLGDSSLAVRREALNAARQVKHPRLWPYVVKSLAHPELREIAAKALVSGGDKAIPILEEAYRNGDTRLRRSIFHIYAQIKTPLAVQRLYAKTPESERDAALELYQALQVCGYQASDAGQRRQIESLLLPELRYANYLNLLQASLQRFEAYLLLEQAVGALRRQSLERIFLLLSFLYPRDLILKSWRGLASSSQEQRSFSLELLDHTLDNPQRQYLIPLVSSSKARNLKLLTAEFLRREVETLATAAAKGARVWERMCALDALSKSDAAESVELLQECRRDPHPLIVETATFLEHRIKGQTPPSLSRFEKICFLLETRMVSGDINGCILLELSEYIQEISLAAQQHLPCEGELKESIFLLISVCVEVRYPRLCTVEYGPGEIFGEISLYTLPSQVNSITALEPCRLLYVSYAELRRLMREHFYMAQAFFRYLCERIHATSTSGDSVAFVPETSSAGIGAVQDVFLSDLEKIFLLKNTYLFRHLDHELLLEIARQSHEHTLQAQQTLCRSGEIGDKLYIVAQGRLRVCREEQILGHIEAREIVGEMSLLSSQVRTATVVAAQPSLLLSLSQDMLFELMQDNFAITEALIKVLVVRLRERISRQSEYTSRGLP